MFLSRCSFILFCLVECIFSLFMYYCTFRGKKTNGFLGLKKKEGIMISKYYKKRVPSKSSATTEIH